MACAIRRCAPCCSSPPSRSGRGRSASSSGQRSCLRGPPRAAPARVGAALYRGAVTGIYLQPLWITLAETLLGFLLGSAVALLVGTAVAASPRTEDFLYPAIVMFQSMPKAALVRLV